jgi:hypothetical protein
MSQVGGVRGVRQVEPGCFRQRRGGVRLVTVDPGASLGVIGVSSAWRMRFKVTRSLLWPTSTGAMPSLRTTCLTTSTMAAHSTQVQPFHWKVSA